MKSNAPRAGLKVLEKNGATIADAQDAVELLTLTVPFPATNNGVTLSDITVQPDGKVLIGGEFTTYNGTGRNFIARLNPDSTLDTSPTFGSRSSEAMARK